MTEVKTKPRRWPMSLGDTADEIAATLLEQGVRGIPKSHKNCIVIRSYKHTYPDGWCGMRAGYSVYRTPGKPDRASGRLTFNDCQIMDPECPPQLAEFMMRFDKGEYPQLISQPIPEKLDVLKMLTIEQQIALGF